MKNRQKTIGRESGIGMIEIMAVIVIAFILATASLIGFSRARASIRLDNSARLLMSNLEKARIDSIRRHADVDTQKAKITLGATSYVVTMDFSGLGTLSDRTVQLESGVTITNPNNAAGAAKVIMFDWRGNDPGGDSLILSNGNKQMTVYVSEQGDVTIDSNPALTNPSAVTVNPTTNIKSLESAASGAATPTPTPCSMTVSPSSLSLSQSASAKVTVTHGGAFGSNTVGAGTNGAVTVSPASQNITANGSVQFTVTAQKKNGNFSVTFSSSCGSKTVTVNVTK